MRWIVLLGIAVLSGALGLAAGALVSSLAVDWYRISSFEGGSGYFVAGIALFSGAAGFVIGLAASVIMRARARPGFLHGLGAAAAVILGIAGATAGVARFFADVPPTLDGEPMLLVAELRWPADTRTPPDRTAIGTLTLGASSGNTIRVSRDGPLLFEDARQDEGRWIVPGVVPVFTERGRRLLQFQQGEEALAGFIVPLPARPGRGDLAWSDWLPVTGGNASPTPYSYRYRVVRVTDPYREQRVGRFTVSTASTNFSGVTSSSRFAATSKFSVAYDGVPVAGLEPLESIAIVGGQPALVGQTGFYSQDCIVIVDTGTAAAVRRLAPCRLREAQPMTGDAAVADRWRARDTAPGWLDRDLLASSGLYRVGPAVLDTRTLSVSPFEVSVEPFPDDSVPPLGLSPDERSVAWIAYDSYRRVATVGVTDWTAGRSYTLPVDRVRMRFVDHRDLGPAWLQHHFEWQRNPDGLDVLVERAGFVPLPYRGKLMLEKQGESQTYWLDPAGEKLRDAIVGMLVADFGARRLPPEYELAQPQVALDGHTVGIQAGSTWVAVSLPAEHGDPAFLKSLAERLEAVFATGRFDALFVSDEPPPESD